MLKRLHALAALASLLMLTLLFAACSPSKVGTVPRGTPDTGSGTPATIPTAAATATPALPKAPASSTGAFYAFVRNNQLWVALNSGTPTQVTHFDFSKAPAVFWHVPSWSPGDHYIAAVVNANPAGLGGGGCPGPDPQASGSLYVMDTATKQFVAITVSTPTKNAAMNGVPQDDSWQYVFWEDATHLLAWYNGATGKSDTTAGLYRYTVTTQTLTRVIPLSALGASMASNPQKGMPVVLSMHYSSGQLFYQVVVKPFEQQSQVVIYSHSVVHPEAQSNKVFQTGTEPWCTPPAGGAYVKPGWDVSADGQQLVAQVIAANGPDQGSSTIQALNLNDNSTTALFAQAPADLLGHDLSLTWGPDNQTVVAAQYHALTQSGPYSASLANPTAMQQYAPNFVGQVVWRPDTSAFAIQSSDETDVTGNSDVYVFLKGDTHGRILLADARQFSWG